MPSGPYRAGPWPGLTPSGALIVLCCAALLAIGLVLIGPSRQALPDLPVLGVTALLPMAIAVRIVNAPGAAAAACGAYLLPRTLLSLLIPSLELPPMLLVPALAFDLALWLMPDDFGRVREAWPWRSHSIRSRGAKTVKRGPTVVRASLAGALFGLVIAAMEPPFEILLGHDPALWSGPSAWLAGVLTVVACGFIARLCVRGTAA